MEYEDESEVYDHDEEKEVNEEQDEARKPSAYDFVGLRSQLGHVYVLVIFMRVHFRNLLLSAAAIQAADGVTFRHLGVAKVNSDNEEEEEEEEENQAEEITSAKQETRSSDGLYMAFEWSYA